MLWTVTDAGKCLGRVACLVFLGFLAGVVPAAAQPRFETTAPNAILIDHDSGAVLFEKEADKAVPPASLAKLMTAEIVFDQLAKGKLKPEDEFTVSQEAWRRGGASSGGSTMFLPLNSRVALKDLIPGLLVQSGNDAAIVLAEGIGGSVEGFARMQNEKAKELGLKNSTYANPHGLPDPAQNVSMRDMTTLARHMIREHADYYKVFSQAEFEFNGIKQANRNPLLAMGMGADGLKTGHTAASGYALVASAERDGQRLILAMTGMKSPRERADEARKLMEWGFRSFEQAVIAKAGEKVGEARVTGGAQSIVPLVGAEAIKVLRPRGEEGALKTEVVRSGPIVAPVRKGDKVATLRISKGDMVMQEVPLVAGADVERGTFFQRAWETVTDTVTEFVANRI